MLIYPGFTALDFMGPHHFLGGMPRAKIHVVTTQRDLSPVASDLGLLVQPTTTMDNCPPDLALIFVPGGTVGTVVAAVGEPASGVCETWMLPSATPSATSVWLVTPEVPPVSVPPPDALASWEGLGSGEGPPVVGPPVLPPVVGQVSEGTKANFSS